MSKNKVKAKGFVELQEAIGYLENILQGMKDGRVVVNQGDQSVTFQAADAMEMEIEAKHKDGKQELSLELKWRERQHVGGMEGLTISSQEASA
ncbi:MAG: amphi-Trp domain-containing protein [Desulfomonilaceae bacterium]